MGISLYGLLLWLNKLFYCLIGKREYGAELMNGAGVVGSFYW